MNPSKSTDQNFITLFGYPQVRSQNRIIKFRRKKPIALLIYLLLEKQTQRRDELALLFCTESGQKNSRSILRRSLYQLKESLGGEHLGSNRESIYIYPDFGFRLDVQEFQDGLQQVKKHDHSNSIYCESCSLILDRILELYTGDFMAGFYLEGCSNFENWVFRQREKLHQQLKSVLEMKIAFLCRLGRYKEAIPLAHRLFSEDKLKECSFQILMSLHSIIGESGKSMQLFEKCRALLREELDCEPDQQTKSLLKYIKEKKELPDIRTSDACISYAMPAETDSSPPPKTTASDKRGQLPKSKNPLIGKEKELVKICSLLNDPSCRLLTLTGMGGIGKTRLALKSSDRNRSEFKDGIFWVSFAGTPSSCGLLDTILLAMKIDNVPGQSALQTLSFKLRKKKTLLVLDNLEDILDQGQDLAALLENTDYLKVLATSREILDTDLERVLQVKAMNIPETGGSAEFEKSEAFLLFQSHAKQLGRSESYSPNEIKLIAQICRQVGGLPLGIELAARWTRLLPLQEIADEIEKSIDFLKKKSTTGHKDHVSLKAVFESSWRLFSPEEQTVFSGLSVFCNGFSKDGALEVAQADYEMLTSFWDKSLICKASPGQFELHPVLKHFLLEKLNQNASHKRLLQRHFCKYYAGHLGLSSDDSSFCWTDENWPDLKLAYLWAVELEEWTFLLKLIQPLQEFLARKERIEEGVKLFNYALEKIEIPENQPETTVKLLLSLMYFNNRLGAWKLVKELGQQTLELCRRTEDWAGYCKALISLAVQEYALGRYSQAKTLYEKALEVNIKKPDQNVEAIALNGLASVFGRENEYEGALKLNLKAMALFEQLGSKKNHGLGWIFMGILHAKKGDYSLAEQSCIKSIHIFKDLGYPIIIAEVFGELGLLKLYQNKLKEARLNFAKSLKLSQNCGFQQGICEGYLLFALCDYKDNKLDRAEKLCEKVVDLARQSPLKQNLAEIYHLRALIYQKQGFLDQAENAALEAISTVLKHSGLDRSHDYLLDYSAILREKKQDDKADKILAFYLNESKLTFENKKKLQALLDERYKAGDKEKLDEISQTFKGVTLEDFVQKLLEAFPSEKLLHVESLYHRLKI